MLDEPVALDLEPLLSFEAASARVVAHLSEVVPMCFWSVTRLAEGRQVYLSVRDEAYGASAGASHAWSDSFCQHMVTGATPRIAPDAMAVPQYATAGVARTLAIGSYVGIPIRAADGSLFGTICGLDPDVRGADLQDHAPLLHLLADQLGRILESSELREDSERQERLLRWQSAHDQLTGLPNRTTFLERLNDVVDLLEHDRQPVSVLLVDLDGFTAVNDALGRAAGDRLIADVGARVASLLGAVDTVARLDGDRFAVLLAGGRDPLATAGQILAALREPSPVPGLEPPFPVDASVGIAELGSAPGSVTADRLLAHAEVALHVAKSDGRGQVVVHRPGMELPDARDLPLRAPLRRAVATGGIDVFYQPVVDLATGRTIAFEALARWEHDGRPVPPDVFVPIAARSGILPALTTHVLETVGAQLARWSTQLGHHDLRVSVNFPAASITDPALPSSITGWARRHGVRPEQLVLEITEDALLSDFDAVRSTTAALEDLGVGVALDDFGTGYSSLVHLRRIPLRYVKIDRGFTDDLASNPVTERFMGALLHLGSSLGLEVQVEGIESREQAAVLQRLGCRLAQGYLFARPAPADECRLDRC